MTDKKYKISNGQTKISLVGCGGTGSILAHHLVRLDLAMRALGHTGLEIRLFDPDVVTEANIGRQLFSEGEVGGNKAEMLAYKLRRNYLVDLSGVPKSYESSHWYKNEDVLIVCVDTKASRKDIRRESSGGHASRKIVIDCGNTDNTGQVLMNHPDSAVDIYEAWDQLIKGEDSNEPSCSLAEALGRQELFINTHVATACSQMLWGMLRHGGINYRGVFMNFKDTQEVRVWT
tara:strand:- start:2129 stop:2824 length:696 start_codon:yes stop_codon:yes gene_type:complete